MGIVEPLDLVHTHGRLSPMKPPVIMNVHEAKTRLSRLLARVEQGQEFVLARAGRPIAKLVPYDGRPRRIIGRDEGLFDVPDDFDEPLAEDVAHSFEG